MPTRVGSEVFVNHGIEGAGDVPACGAEAAGAAADHFRELSFACISSEAASCSALSFSATEGSCCAARGKPAFAATERWA